MRPSARVKRSSHFHQPRRSVRRRGASQTAPARPASPVKRCSQSSSSSVSSSEEPVSEKKSALPNYLGVAQIPWFAMNRASVVHIIQEVEDGRLIPWCRSSSFSGGVAEQGLDPTSQPLPVCSGCQKRLPTDMRLAIEEGLADKPPTTPSEDNVLE